MPKRKDAKKELWQLKMGLAGIIQQLNQGVDHLDPLTSKTIARALSELLQETISLADNSSQEDIEQFARDLLAGTAEMQHDLAQKWYDELLPLMQRANKRTYQLGHELDQFGCLTADGQEWGAICIKCLSWIYVRPDGVHGDALLNDCSGWYTSWRN